ncbi:MAG: DEAD/DEAH box helicase family protein [Methanobrevibacter sp.]|jgi:type III restriction enzyme|nr:DEAD/DEAH box helicase family protein [Candidatus Methanovirga basalitermitum]
MTLEAQNLQNNAVSEIIEALKTKTEVTFKAPTGSGKTVMIAELMDKLLEKNKDLVFIVSSLSKSELAQQNDRTFQEWSKNGKNFLKHIDPYLISTDTSNDESGVNLEYNHNVYTIPRDLAKKGGKIMSGPLASLMHNFKLSHKKLILIKDECHIETKNIDKIADDHDFFKRINVSATPQTTKFIVDVEITEKDAIEAKLIKHYLPTRGEGKSYAEDKYHELNECLKLFIDIRKKYQETFNINPCLIIQIPNTEKGDEELAHLKKLLNKEELELK